MRNYACLWTCENPRDAIKQYEDENGVRGIDAMRPFLNPDSIRINRNAYVEKYVQTLQPLHYLQFTRTGYLQYRPRFHARAFDLQQHRFAQRRQTQIKDPRTFLLS